MHFRPARRWTVLLVAVTLVLVGVGVSLSLPRAFILMATTTSTRDTGLLPYLLPQFTADTGIDVRYVAVGTGLALDMGRGGDVDAVMVHAPALEAAFVAAGDGLCRNLIMYNRFVIVGPDSDPAGVRGAANATEAFRRIHDRGSAFESRADRSGTHTRELELWGALGLDASEFGPWYEETGQGMGATLTIANERDAYTLADDGTWYVREASLPFLRLLYGADDPPDPLMRNQYSVIPVNPAAHPRVHVADTLTFARWLVGPRGQALIGDYRVGGHAIFTANGAGAC